MDGSIEKVFYIEIIRQVEKSFPLEVDGLVNTRSLVKSLITQIFIVPLTYNLTIIISRYLLLFMNTTKEGDKYLNY